MMLSKDRSRPKAKIDTSDLPFGQEPRIRCRAHLDWVKRLKCVVPGCRIRECDPHHLLSGPEGKARGETAGDNWAVSLCRTHHNELHDMGDEQKFAARHRVNLIATALVFWNQSPFNPANVRPR